MSRELIMARELIATRYKGVRNRHRNGVLF